MAEEKGFEPLHRSCRPTRFRVTPLRPLEYSSVWKSTAYYAIIPKKKQAFFKKSADNKRDLTRERERQVTFFSLSYLNLSQNLSNFAVNDQICPTVIAGGLEVNQYQPAALIVIDKTCRRIDH